MTLRESRGKERIHSRVRLLPHLGQLLLQPLHLRTVSQQLYIANLTAARLHHHLLPIITILVRTIWNRYRQVFIFIHILKFHSSSIFQFVLYLVYVFISQHSANKYLRKAAKLLINKSKSRWLSWLKGYEKKSGKYLNIFEQLIPELQESCMEISNELECTFMGIRRSQTTLISYLLLLKLSFCLHSSKSYLYEDVLDETKKLKYTLEAEKKKLEAGKVFNRELFVFAEAETKKRQSLQPSVDSLYICEIGGNNGGNDSVDHKDIDVINVGKSKRHEHQPAVWVGCAYKYTRVSVWHHCWITPSTVSSL